MDFADAHSDSQLECRFAASTNSVSKEGWTTALRMEYCPFYIDGTGQLKSPYKVLSRGCILPLQYTLYVSLSPATRIQSITIFYIRQLYSLAVFGIAN